MNCREFEERIVDLAEGVAPNTPEEKHLAGCPECRSLLARSRDTCATLRSLPSLELPLGAYEKHLRRRERKVRRLWLPLSVAAAALLAGSLSALLMRGYKPMPITVHEVEETSGLLADDPWIGAGPGAERR